MQRTGPKGSGRGKDQEVDIGVDDGVRLLMPRHGKPLTHEEQDVEWDDDDPLADTAAVGEFDYLSCAHLPSIPAKADIEVQHGWMMAPHMMMLKMTTRI